MFNDSQDLVQNFRLGKLRGVRNGISLFDAFEEPSGKGLSAKVLDPTAAGDPLVRGRFLREFKAASRVRSPNVIQYLGIHPLRDGGMALLTEQELGMSLRAALALRTFDVEEAVVLFLHIARGISACHEAGVVHRDVRPENVLIDDQGFARITQFGLSFFSQATVLTMTGVMLQAPEYAPPESLLQTTQDIRTDVYSAGVLFWEVLVGRNPFDGMTISEMLGAKKDPLQPPSALNPEVPDWLDRLVLWMTDPERDARPISGSLVVVSLDEREIIALPVGPRIGRCHACGQSRLPELWFCCACGNDFRPGGKERMGVLVSRVDRVEGIRLFLSRTLAWPDNVTELRIPRPPFLVGTKFSNIEARWLQDELAGVGVVAEVVVPEKVGFRLSSLIFILLFSTIFFLGLLWFRVNETLSQSGPGVFALFNISIIIPLGAGMVFALRYLQVSPLQLPKFWITGLAAIGGSTLQKSRFEANSRRGFILLVLLLALALFVASYGSFISCFPMGIYELRRGSPESFLLLVLGIGPILIWKLLYGRLTYRKLSSIELPVSDSAKFHQLEKLRIALDEVRLPEFRFLVSRIVETSLAARRIPDSGAGSELEDVLGECIQAAHLTSTIFARLTLQGAVGGIAEEVKYQAARLEIERRLNLLRNCIGSMVTAVARHAWEKGSPENHSRWRDSLALLKAQLVEVTAL